MKYVGKIILAIIALPFILILIVALMINHISDALETIVRRG